MMTLLWYAPVALGAIPLLWWDSGRQVRRAIGARPDESLEQAVERMAREDRRG